MQYIVARHNITVYHTCILHYMIYFPCAFVQIRSYVVDAKDSKIQYLEVHITYSLQLSAAKLRKIFDICKKLSKKHQIIYIFSRNIYE